MKRFLSLVLVVIMAFVITGSVIESAEAQEPIKLLYIHGSSDTSILQQTALHFKELIENSTSGRYTIEIHPSFELGTLTESVEMIKAGEVALSGVCLGSYYTPELAFTDLPNAVPSIDAAYKLYAESDFRETVNEIMRNNGIELLSFGAAYFREMSSNVPVYNLEDIEGINIRTMANPLHMAYWKALGANPSPLAWAEVYIGLQQGLVDAEENPYDSINAAKLYEVQDYVINTHHIVYTSPIMVNKEFFDSLSSEDQEIFIQCGKDTEKFTYNAAKESVDALRQTLEDHGMTIIDLPVETLNAMREKASSVYDTVRDTIGDEIMDTFMSALDEAQK
jgi:tripartite ATP-independent transporter DctP family solute receptor